MTMTIEDSRKFWQCAQAFPLLKEEVYKNHADAHAFDLFKTVKVHDDSSCDVARVLEYGCGNGSDTLSLLRRGYDVAFTDIVPGNVAMTEDRVQKAGYRVYSAQVLKETVPLPFGPALFVGVTSHGVVHHIENLEDRKALIFEFRRVLKPGGLLAIMLYTEMLFARCAKSVGRTVDNFTRYEFGGCTDGSGCYAEKYTEAEGWDLILPAGFEKVRSTVYNDGDFRTFLARAI